MTGIAVSCCLAGVLAKQAMGHTNLGFGRAKSTALVLQLSVLGNDGAPSLSLPCQLLHRRHSLNTVRLTLLLLQTLPQH